MNSEDREKLDRWIDAYVDRRLSPEQQTQFESLMQRDPAVRSAVDLQNNIDQSLNRLFPPPAFSNGSAKTLHQSSNNGEVVKPAAPAKKQLVSNGVLAFAVAATLLVVAIGGWQVWMQMDAGSQSEFAVRRYTLGEAYRELEKIDFKAEWLCEDDKQFAQTFHWRYQQALAMATPPANIVPTGISYVWLKNSDSPRTVEVIAKADGKGVVVFVDPFWKAGESEDVGAGLYLHKKKLAKLTLYEVSPFDKPLMLGLLSERDIPEDWKMAPQYCAPPAASNSNQNSPDDMPPDADKAPSKWKPATP